MGEERTAPAKLRVLADLCGDQAMRAAGSGITLPRKASPPKIHRPRIAAKPASDIVRFLVMLFLAGALWGVRVEPSEVLIVVFSDASVVFLG